MSALALACTAAALGLATDPCNSPTNCTHVTGSACEAAQNKVQQWQLPDVGGAPSPIRLKADASLCLDFLCDQDPCYMSGKYGPGAYVLTCTEMSPKFRMQNDSTITIVSGGSAPTIGYCLDMRNGRDAQAYPCVGSINQQFTVDLAGGTFKPNGPAAYAAACVTACTGATPPPPPAAPFCPLYHPIHDPGVYDPSGPLLDSQGVWHQWEDKGAWSHWTSRDLVHWNGSFSESTGFGGDTGSVSPTPSGVYAFWPIMSGVGKGAIGSAKSLDPDGGMTQWQHRGPTIPMPSRIDAGYRDPVRAFQYPTGNGGKWYVGVGCGIKSPASAEFCLFEAHDDTLAAFDDKGSLFSTNVTFGQVDGDQVWQPVNVSANMMECPDLFPLGADGKWVLIGSLYKTNQWWVGTLSGDPPRFSPERVGILDYGNGYAAKSGSTMVQGPASRRLVFGFTGWSEPTMVPGCGRSLILPRELGVVGDRLSIAPVAETAALRISESRRLSTLGPVPAADLADVRRSGVLALGSQVEVRMRCPGAATAARAAGCGAASGKSCRVGVRTLASADQTSYLEIGYDFSISSAPDQGEGAMYADHSKCCASPNTIVQRAPLPTTQLVNGTLTLAVFVDGGLVEAFAADRVAITPLVSPDNGKTPPGQRETIGFSTFGGIQCDYESWQLKY